MNFKKFETSMVVFTIVLFIGLEKIHEWEIILFLSYKKIGNSKMQLSVQLTTHSIVCCLSQKARRKDLQIFLS